MNAVAQIGVARCPVHAPRATAVEMLSLLADGLELGRQGALATIVGLTASGARAVGTQMAVLDNGDTAGSLSNGCVETAIIAEALDVLREGKPRVVRFGQGSRYIDIRLPCGGGMDVLFEPVRALEAIREARALLVTRRPVRLALCSDPCDGEISGALADDEGYFSVRHTPPLRVVVFGNGPETLAFVELAQAYGATVEVHSPTAEVVDAARARGIMSKRLLSVSALAKLTGDPWTAFLFLFHDHDWETGFLVQALSVQSLWIGAMGSSRTHANRCEMLKDHGVGADAVSRIKGPVGLIRSTRDPSTLALSVLAEIVEAYGRTALVNSADLEGPQTALVLSLIKAD